MSLDGLKLCQYFEQTCSRLFDSERCNAIVPSLREYAKRFSVEVYNC